MSDPRSSPARWLPLAALALLAVAPGLVPQAAARPERTVRVVLALDEEFRQVHDGEPEARRILEAATAPLAEDFGLKFEVGRVVAWESLAPPPDLYALHDELVSKVPPGDCDLVIGLVGWPSGGPERRLTRLGHSDTPGRYIIVSDRAGPDFALVLRHEIGHAFGVPHVNNVPSLMNEEVHHDRGAFDPVSARILENNAGLDFTRSDPFANCPLDRLYVLYDLLAGQGNSVADLISLVGESHRHRGEYEAADLAYNRALELQPDLLSAELGLGLSAMTQRRFADAVRHLEEVRSRSDKPLAGLDYNLGMAYVELGQGDNAYFAYRRALEVDPRDPIAMNNLALVCLDRNSNDEAESLLRSAVDIRPAFTEAWNNLGLLYSRLGRNEDAMAAWRRSLETGETPEAHRNLASVLLQLGRRQEAREHIEAALRLAPDQADAEELRRLARTLP